MTTATTRLNTAFLTMAQRGERPRCSDPSTTNDGPARTQTTELSQPDGVPAVRCLTCVVMQPRNVARMERLVRHRPLHDPLIRAPPITRRARRYLLLDRCCSPR